MAESLLVRGARQLLTLRGAPHLRRGPDLQELSIIRDGALLIKDGGSSKLASAGVSKTWLKPIAPRKST